MADSLSFDLAISWLRAAWDISIVIAILVLVRTMTIAVWPPERGD